MTADFSLAVKQWNNTLKYREKKNPTNCQPRILHAAKISLSKPQKKCFQTDKSWKNSLPAELHYIGLIIVELI